MFTDFDKQQLTHWIKIVKIMITTKKNCLSLNAKREI